MASADITRYALSLGSQDSTTGWYARSFASSTISGSIQPRGATLVGNNGFYAVASYPQTLFTADSVSVGDEIEDSNGDYYVIYSVDAHWWLDQFTYYACGLEKRSPYALLPTTSGTWHVDSDSVKTDPRNRHKTWLDDYLTADNMELDDGTTDATIHTMFSKAPYPLSQVFITKDADGIFSVDKQTPETLTTCDLGSGPQPYAFIESVPITCYTVNKSGLTATNLLEQMEQEIRHICTDYPLGSIRSIKSTEHECTQIGGVKLWHTTVTIRYKRANDDYTATYPQLTWGPSASPTGTFIFPNVMDIEYFHAGTDAISHPPSFVGDIKQPMGDGPLRVKITSDLDIEPAALTWMRPQASTPKTDDLDWQVFADIKHNGGIDEAYQTLKLAWCATSGFKVRIIDYNVISTGDMRSLEVTFEEYTNADQSGNTIAQRWNIA